MTNSLKSLLLVSTGILALGLTGCTSTGTSTPKDPNVVNNALMRAADQATSGGITSENLKLLENLYKRDPQNPETAIRFARGLREMNELTKAAIILEPFSKNPNASSVLKLEYATIQLEAGRYEQAERVARDVVNMDETSGFAHHILGTALDAQGLHAESETAFRNALSNWTGDPVPVMNNLALSLTAQEKLEEAYEILMQAKTADPTRIEIERNLRIVNALRETVSYEAQPGRTGPGAPVDLTKKE